MGAIFVYAIKVAICLALLYLPFTLLMSRETFHAFNRKALLGIIAISLVIPCFNIPVWDNSIFDSLNQQKEAIIEIGMPQLMIEEAVQNVANTTETTENVPLTFSWINLIIIIYMTGVLACLVWKIIQMARLITFIPKGCLWTNKEDGINIYCHAGKVSPFSWMNNVVISEEDYENNPSIMLHEKAHISKHHSLDSILINLMEVFQWFNPCIWMLETSMNEIHEFEADESVLRSGITAKSYQLLLINKAVASSKYQFANGFNHSLLKNRINMMMKKESNKWSRAKVLYILPVAFIALACFATKAIQASAKAVEETEVLTSVSEVTNIDIQATETTREGEVQTVTEETESQEEEAVPQVAEKRTITGKVVDEAGKPISVLPVQVLDKESRIVKTAMTKEDGTFEMEVEGEDLRIRFSYIGYNNIELPLSKTEYNVTLKEVENPNAIIGDVNPNEQSGDGDEVFMIVEEMPEFEGGMAALMEYLAKNIKYPKIALSVYKQGRVVVRFVVGKDGSLSEVEPVMKELANQKEVVYYDENIIFNGPYKDLDLSTLSEEDYSKFIENPDNKTYLDNLAGKALCDEAVKTVKSMPKWKPGKQRGKEVRVQYTVPINFRLN